MKTEEDKEQIDEKKTTNQVSWQEMQAAMPPHCLSGLLL